MPGRGTASRRESFMTQFIEKEQKMIRKDYTHKDTKKSACHHLADDEDFVRRLVQETLNEVLGRVR